MPDPINLQKTYEEAEHYLQGRLRDDCDPQAAARDAVDEALASWDGEPALNCEVVGFFTRTGNPLAFEVQIQSK